MLGQPIDDFFPSRNITNGNSSVGFNVQLKYGKGLPLDQFVEIANRVDREYRESSEPKGIKYLKTDPVQWRLADRDDRGGYDKRPLFFLGLAVYLPGALALFFLFRFASSVIGALFGGPDLSKFIRNPNPGP